MTNDFQPLITPVDQILAAKKKDPDADTSALEREIDKMVYKLYDPAYRQAGSRRKRLRLWRGKGKISLKR